MTVTQTVEIPADHRLAIDVPREVPASKTIISFTPVPEAAKAVCTAKAVCPVCARKFDSVTGNPRYNAETVAAIEEGRAMMRGEIPAMWFNSLNEMLEDLEKDDPDEEHPCDN